MKPNKLPSYKYENQKMAEGFSAVIGCDEVGRGCLAGPVVAAAVILNPTEALSRDGWYKHINDSKKVAPGKRFMLELLIRERAVAWGLGVAGPDVIDEINIHAASLLAMNRALENLLEKFSHGTFLSKENLYAVVDGKFAVPNCAVAHTAVIKADETILSVSAASVLAKAYRDRLMMRLHSALPAYEFHRHKGYATASHWQRLQMHGLSKVHRKTFCGALN